MIYATPQINRSYLKMYSVTGFDFSISDYLAYAAEAQVPLAIVKIERREDLNGGQP
jgi:hypothetical protein